MGDACMSSERNKAIVRRFIESYNKRNLDVFDELVSTDYIDHSHHQRGRDGLKQLFTLAFDAFPDWHEHIEAIVGEGDEVWVMVTATGTHTGAWNHFGVMFPPTGRKIIMRMVFIWRIMEARLSEGWEVDDQLEFLKQLGAIEFMEQGKKLFPKGST
jgi:C-1 hydroxylase